jgi:hypothetical protein
MDKWLTVPPDLELFIGSALALYSLYRPKKKRWFKPMRRDFAHLPFIAVNYLLIKMLCQSPIIKLFLERSKIQTMK